MENRKAKNLIIVILIILLLACLGVVIWQHLKINNILDNQEGTMNGINNTPTQQENNGNKVNENKEQDTGKTEKEESNRIETISVYKRNFADDVYYEETIQLNDKNIEIVEQYLDERETVNVPAGLGLDSYKLVLKYTNNSEIETTIHGDNMITYDGRVYKCSNIEGYIEGLAQTIGWKKFEDADLGVSLRYPDVLRIEESSNNVCHFYHNDEKENTDVSMIYILKGNDDNIEQGQNVNVGKNNAIYVAAKSPMGYTYYTYYIKANNEYIQIRMNVYPDEEIISMEDFKLIVGSIEILQ